MITGFKYFVSATIQFAICCHTYCQYKPQLRFFHFGIEQGLSNNTVNCLLQDKTGFLWIGTDNGLNRYDGYQFVVVGGGNDKNTIASAQVVSLFEDKEETIWIGTKTAGLHRYYPKTGNIIHFVNTGNKQVLSDNYIRTICADSSGMLWLGTPNGLTRFNPKTYEIKIFRNSPGNKYSLGDNDIRAMCKAKATNTIWIGTYNKGLFRLDPASEKFRTFPTAVKSAQHPDTLNTRAISALYEDDKNRLWMGGYGMDGLEYLNTITEKFNDLNTRRFLHNTTNVFIQDGIGRFWMGGWEGLALFDPAIHFLGLYTHDNSDPFSLTNRFITSMIKDRNGLIWLGTKNRGLNCFYPFSEKFLVYSHRDNDPYSLSSNLIQSISKDTLGIMWIGTRYGLDTGKLETGVFNIFRHSPVAYAPEPGADINFMRWDTIKNKIYHQVYGPHKYRISKINGGFKIPKSDKYNPLPYNNEFITGCITDRMRNTWIGTYGFGLYRIEYPTGDFTVFCNHTGVGRSRSIYSESQLSYGGVIDMMEGKNGKLWFGTERGLDMYDPVTGIFTTYLIDRNDTIYSTNSASINYIQKMAEDPNGNIWVGTNNAGVYVLDIETKTFTGYKVTGKNDNTAFSHITSLCVAKDGIVYAGTESGGIIVIDAGNKNVTILNTGNGLPDNSIAGILEDDKGHLWISTYHGLCQYATQREKKQAHQPTGILKIFTTADGLPSDEFLKGAYYKDAGGRMYFGNAGGLVSFVPEELNRQSILAPLVLTDFQLFNHSLAPGDSTGILFQNISATRELKLKYNQNIITLSFAALGYINADNTRYSYRLVGFNDQWFNTKPGERSVTYTSLQPGTYTFEVKAGSATGGNIGQMESLSIQVTPPFWRTLWFLALVMGLLILLVYLLYRSRLKSAIMETEKKSAIDRQISELSLTALRSRMNPHFIFNSLSSVQYLVQSMDNKKAETYINDLSRLIRAMLENSDKPAIPLSDELEMLNKYIELESIRFGNRFDFSINVADDIETEYIQMPSMLIQPFVENAIVHAFKGMTEKGHITITMTMEDNLLHCTIEDNGIGRSKSGQLDIQGPKHKSIAIDDTKNRMDIMSKMLEKNVRLKITDLVNEKQQPVGTRVELFIAVKERF